MNKQTSALVGGKTVAEWNSKGVSIQKWMDPTTYNLHGQVGLIRFWQAGRVVAISVATEFPAGCRKRLADFYRDSESGRNYATGRRIYAERHSLKVDVIITGSDLQAQRLARELKSAMLRSHPPEWFHTLSFKPRSRKARPKPKLKPFKAVSAAAVVI